MGDWLSSREEPGQTHTQFLASKPNKPGLGGRKTIYLQPIGEFTDSAPKIADAVFGMARSKERVGVFSFSRHGDEPDLALKRAVI